MNEPNDNEVDLNDEDLPKIRIIKSFKGYIHLVQGYAIIKIPIKKIKELFKKTT